MPDVSRLSSLSLKKDRRGVVYGIADLSGALEFRRRLRQTRRVVWGPKLRERDTWTPFPKGAVAYGLLLPRRDAIRTVVPRLYRLDSSRRARRVVSLRGVFTFGRVTRLVRRASSRLDSILKRILVKRRLSSPQS